jgi:exodeoxyribonuclease VII small subunit
MKKAKNFEDALSQLEGIVQELEEGEIGLEDSLKRYKEGMELHRFCQDRLRSVELELMKVLGDDPEVQDDDLDELDDEPVNGELPF